MSWTEIYYKLDISFRMFFFWGISIISLYVVVFSICELLKQKKDRNCYIFLISAGIFLVFAGAFFIYDSFSFITIESLNKQVVTHANHGDQKEMINVFPCVYETEQR